jgi:hypothetical protein
VRRSARTSSAGKRLYTMLNCSLVKSNNHLTFCSPKSQNYL